MGHNYVRIASICNLHTSDRQIVTTDKIHRRGNDFSVGRATIERLFGWGSKNWWTTIRLIHVICRISQTSMYKLMQSVTTIMPLWKAVLSPLWRPSEAWGRGLLNRLNPLLLPRRRRYRIDLSPLRGSSSPVGTLSRRGWNPIKLAYKLAGWPAQLATSAFSQLSQYIC